VETRSPVMKMLLLAGVPVCQNYQRIRSTTVIVCVRNAF